MGHCGRLAVMDGHLMATGSAGSGEEGPCADPRPSLGTGAFLFTDIELQHAALGGNSCSFTAARRRSCERPSPGMAAGRTSRSAMPSRQPFRYRPGRLWLRPPRRAGRRAAAAALGLVRVRDGPAHRCHRRAPGPLCGLPRTVSRLLSAGHGHLCRPRRRHQSAPTRPAG